MTNYDQYPKWRDYYGIIIEFGEHQYSWSRYAASQRKYLFESDYCDGARRIYVCNNKEGFYLSELPEELALAFIDAAIAANPGDQDLIIFRNEI